MPITLVKASLQERVRAKLRDMVKQGDVSLEVLGTHLGLSRSGVSRILNEESYSILLPHIETLCAFFQITPSELMADPEALIQAVSPVEAALLRFFRDMTDTERMALIAILEGRGQRPGKARRARLGSAELTTEHQTLVELFVQSNQMAREGVMKILRGAAAAVRRKGTDDLQ